MKQQKKDYDGFISFGLLLVTVSVSFLSAVPSDLSPYVIFLPIVLFAFTIGFAISGLRQSGTGNHVFAGLAIAIPAVLIVLLAFP